MNYELLSYSALSESEVRLIHSFMQECNISEMTKPVREIAIEVRKKYRLKIPDAVIAATSIHLDFPLITMDKDFEKLDDLNVVILEI